MVDKEIEKDTLDEKKPIEIKLKSELYNHNAENIVRREDEDASDAVMWGCVIGFILFFILLIMLILFTH